MKISDLNPDYARKQRERFVIAIVNARGVEGLSISAIFDLAELFIEESEKRYQDHMSAAGIAIKPGRRLPPARGIMSGTSRDAPEPTTTED